MEKKRNDYPRLDMSKVSSKPSKTTSDTDIVPIKWNNEVLTGKRKVYLTLPGEASHV